MDKRHNNKKHNKNKHNNKNKNNNSNNQNRNKTQNDETPQNSSQQTKLSAQQRKELNNLVGLLVKENVFENYTNPNEEWRQYENIQGILKQIQAIEAPLQRKRATEEDSRLANIEKFYQWAKDNGVHYEGLEIKKFPDYDLGLVATRDIKKDDLLFTIPRQLILSEENLQYEFVHNCFKFSNMRLAFTLMMESLKEDSFWKPYIDLLPDSYSTVLYYTPEEMAELKGSNALSGALKLCLIIARLYVNIYSWPEGAIPFKGFKEIFNYDLIR